MSREESRTWLVKLVTMKATLDGRWDQLQRLTGCDSGSSLGKAVWEPIDVLIDAVAQIIGAAGSLGWFIWDNDSGANGLQHSMPSGEMREVRSVDDLLDVLGY
jgi:hypothetical protein